MMAPDVYIILAYKYYTVNNKRTLLKRMFIEAKINLNMSWTITCGPIEKYLVTFDKNI